MQKETLQILLDKYGCYMTPADVAEVLHNHPTHIRAMCQNGDLPAKMLGNRWFISTILLANLLEP